MKRLISLVLLSAFAVTLFSPTVAALQWDWRKPPPESVYRQTQEAKPNGDDSGWADVSSIGPWFWPSELVYGTFIKWILIPTCGTCEAAEVNSTQSEEVHDATAAKHARSH